MVRTVRAARTIAKVIPDTLRGLHKPDGACFARVNGAPVNFHIRVYTGNASEDVEWNEDNDRIARTNLLNGKIKGYFMFNTPRAFKCCREKEIKSACGLRCRPRRQSEYCYSVFECG